MPVQNVNNIGSCHVNGLFIDKNILGGGIKLRTTVQLLTQVWRDITIEVFQLTSTSVCFSPIDTV